MRWGNALRASSAPYDTHQKWSHYAETTHRKLVLNVKRHKLFSNMIWCRSRHRNASSCVPLCVCVWVRVPTMLRHSWIVCVCARVLETFRVRVQVKSRPRRPIARRRWVGERVLKANNFNCTEQCRLCPKLLLLLLLQFAEKYDLTKLLPGAHLKVIQRQRTKAASNNNKGNA